MKDDIIRQTIPPYRVSARIPLLLDACDAAVDALVELHERVGSAFAEGLSGEDEPAAIWELSGQALGLARAYLVLLRGGYIPASGVMARALHETLIGLQAIAGLDGEAVLGRYLAGHGIKMESARRAVQKTQRRAEADGVKLGDDLRFLAGKIYSGSGGGPGLDEYAHNGRRAVREGVLTGAGAFAYGPHPDAYRKGSHVSYAMSLTVHLVEAVALALSRFSGFTDVYRCIGEPLVARLETVEEQHPLSRSFEAARPEGDSGA